MHNTIDHIVGVSMHTNTPRYHGLSQNHTNEQSGFKAEIRFIPESKLISVETHTETMNLPSTNQTTKMSKVNIRFKAVSYTHLTLPTKA